MTSRLQLNTSFPDTKATKLISI